MHLYHAHLVPQTFISDIRACQSKEAEKTRVDKELGKIRKKFTSSSNISGACSDQGCWKLRIGCIFLLTMCLMQPFCTDYDKKKYIWKLLYIYMLGYDVEFGHKQACDLIPAGKYVQIWIACGGQCCWCMGCMVLDPTHRYAEKQVGYTAASVLLNEVRVQQGVWVG